MSGNPERNEQELLERLKQGDNAAFRSLYDQFYKYLVVTSFNILGDSDKARDLAQDVFVELWKKRESLQIHSALKPYLRRAVVNKTLNYIKAGRIDFNDPVTMPDVPSHLSKADEHLERSEMEELIHEAIAALPERCRIVFTLCRLEEMSHKEIANQLGISTKTIENQMTRALSFLRKALEPYMDKGMISLLLGFFCQILGTG